MSNDNKYRKGIIHQEESKKFFSKYYTPPKIIKPKKSRWYHRHFGDFRIKVMEWKHRLWLGKLKRIGKRYDKGYMKFCVWCRFLDGKSKSYKHIKFLKRKCSKCKTKLIKSTDYQEFIGSFNYRDYKRNSFYFMKANYWKDQGILTNNQVVSYLIKKRVCPFCTSEVVSLLPFTVQNKNIMKCVECEYEKEIKNDRENE